MSIFSSSAGATKEMGPSMSGKKACAAVSDVGVNTAPDSVLTRRSIGGGVQPSIECGEVPDKCGEVPDKCGEVPDGCGEVPDNCGEVPLCGMQVQKARC